VQTLKLLAEKAPPYPLMIRTHCAVLWLCCGCAVLCCAVLRCAALRCAAQEERAAYFAKVPSALCVIDIPAGALLTNEGDVRDEAYLCEKTHSF
jgi:hypothetical protein